ncbi:MAG: 4-hydroxy-tetrahydrodipicolinate reductase, partial [Nitrospirota bacterium]
MIKAVVCGAGGRMGKRIISLIGDSEDVKLAGAIERSGSPYIGLDAGENAGAGRLGIGITDSIDLLKDTADVIIDFTEPTAAIEHVRV